MREIRRGMSNLSNEASRFLDKVYYENKYFLSECFMSAREKWDKLLDRIDDRSCDYHYPRHYRLLNPKHECKKERER